MEIVECPNCKSTNIGPYEVKNWLFCRDCRHVWPLNGSKVEEVNNGKVQTPRESGSESNEV